MRELSVFVDESGDFGEYDYRAPFYIISMVIHDQDDDISLDLKKLESEMKKRTLNSNKIHQVITICPE